MTKVIPLTQGKEALVDDADFDWLAQWKWYAAFSRGRWYAQRTELPAKKTLKMHRVILGVPEGVEVDHKDNNGLNNRRTNLRACTDTQNSQNRRVRSDSVTGYRGVKWCGLTVKGPNKYQTRIKIPGGKRISLGYYPTAEDAARVYDQAALVYHGSFANLNFPVTAP